MGLLRGSRPSNPAVRGRPERRASDTLAFVSKGGRPPAAQEPLMEDESLAGTARRKHYRPVHAQATCSPAGNLGPPSYSPAGIESRRSSCVGGHAPCGLVNYKVFGPNGRSLAACPLMVTGPLAVLTQRRTVQCSTLACGGPFAVPLGLPPSAQRAVRYTPSCRVHSLPVVKSVR